ncbi:hypothetical protein BOW52_04795 [Solemya elarraichensis gill symbiont]|uniref:Uncharacterized protein n=1 Tax=Solemya elarraichensis gill symbiont TaxID=1918949 RepID=A0A1T2L8C1_9GAMM|nr:hypothetical protein BOW52_04795 [Solemya elarraichensis gill symbiont]
MPLKRSGELIIIMLLRIPSGENDKIVSLQKLTLLTKALSYDSFDTVTIDSSRQLLFSNCEAEASATTIILTCQNHEAVVDRT